MRLFTQSIRPLAVATALVLGMGALASSCSSTSSAPDTSNNPTRPAPGSSYTYHLVHTDEAGATIADSSTTYVIADTGVTYAGETGVVYIVGNGDSVHYVNTLHGLTIHRPAIPIYNGVTLPERWIAIDTTNNQPQTIYTQNDTIPYSGTELYFASHATMTPLSDTVVSVAGKTYTAIRWKTESTVTVTVAINNSATTTTVESTRAFAPTLGFFVVDQTVVRGATSQSPVENGTETSTLTSFTIK